MSSSEPPRKVCVAELIPIPEDYSQVPFLKAIIDQSNREKNPKKRHFKGIALYAEGIRRAIKDGDLKSAAQMAVEAVCEKHLTIKAPTTIAPLLYAFFSTSQLEAGNDLYSTLVSCPHADETDIFDDAVTTVAIRILNGLNAPSSQIESLLARVPQQFIKRRLVFEILDVALKRQDLQLSRAVFGISTTADLELWDCDYLKILQTIVVVDQKQLWPQEGWRSKDSALNEIFKYMALQQPIVGRGVIDALAQLDLKMKVDCVDKHSGVCSCCTRTLHGYTLSDKEFAQLACDIIEKLVSPALTKRSHHEKNGETVSSVEVAERKKRFSDFQQKVCSSIFDAVIDGANVGYYGVSNWYAKAKKDQMVRSGRDESLITKQELCEMPLPIDVSPNFEAVESLRKEMVSLGYRPIVVFHERHLNPSDRLFGKNEELLKQWQAEGLVLESPSFLNDDYCWLYACIVKKNCVILTNDLMRDHHFQMLSQRSFVRWRQRHRITFKLGHNGFSLQVPTPYSTWVQCAPNSSTWHLPYVECAVLDQATNKKKPPSALEKNGDDDCDGWACLGLECESSVTSLQ